MGRFRRNGDPNEGRERFNFTHDRLEAPPADTYSTALLAVDDEGVIERVTFLQLGQAAARWAALLRARGLEPGDRLLVAVDDAPTWSALLLGAVKAGVVAVHANGAAPDALEHVTTHSGARLLVTDRDYRETADGLPRVPFGTIVVAAVGGELLSHAPVQPSQETFAGEAAVVLYDLDTSGGVVTTYDHGFLAELADRPGTWLDVGPGDTVWCAAAPGSDAAVGVLLGSLGRGAAIILEPRTLPIEEHFELLARLRVTVLYETPARLQELSEDESPIAVTPQLRLAVPLTKASLPLAGEEGEYVHTAPVSWETVAVPVEPTVSRQAAKLSAKDEKRRQKQEERRRKDEERAAESAARAEHEAEERRRREEAEAKAADERAQRALERAEAERLHRAEAEEAATAQANVAAERARRELEFVEAEHRRQAEAAARAAAEAAAAAAAKDAAAKERRETQLAEAERRRQAEAAAKAEAEAKAAAARETRPAPAPAAAPAATESGAAPESPLIQRLEAYGRNARPPLPDPPAD